MTLLQFFSFTHNQWSLENVTTPYDRIEITNFSNCSQSTFNFTYVKENGVCTGAIYLYAGYKYKITLICNEMLLYIPGEPVQRSPPPDIYIYYSKNPDGNASAKNKSKAINCGFGDRCTVSIHYTTDKLTEDNSTLHFKLKTTQELKNGAYCNFSGYFTIELA
jgi:hypothetical protein